MKFRVNAHKKNLKLRRIHFNPLIYMFQEMYEDAIRDSTKALDLNPEYLKARLRRAQCYEHEDKLEEALEGNGTLISFC